MDLYSDKINPGFGKINPDVVLTQAAEVGGGGGMAPGWNHTR